MDKFDFSALLKLHEKRHKGKPAQFSSVAGGVKNRLQNNLKYRKSSRLTDFDNFRNLAICESPAPASKAQLKVEHRRQQLEKWKEEKEKRKKEQVTKKKPFLTGIPHNPLRFVPPPPAKPMPSTSGRVTRSQTTKNYVTKTKKKEKEQKQTASQSFAPENASFKPPFLKTKLPPLPLNKPKKQTKTNITFDPVLPGSQKYVRQTRSKTISNSVTNDIKNNNTKQNEKETKGKLVKQSIKMPKFTKHPLSSSNSSSSNTQSSTSSESDQKQSPIPNRPPRKSICKENSQVIRNRTPRKSIRGSKQFTPNNPVPKSESSSEERLRSPKSPVEIQKTPEQIVAEATMYSPLVTKSRGKENARKEMKKKMEEGLVAEDSESRDMEAVAQFRRQVASETDRISSMCSEWDAISTNNNHLLPDAVQEAILGAVGQARLLMSQKLVQFSQLVDRCARGCERDSDAQALVTCADLHGFWDMVYMQVVNVDMRFKKLEEMRARNWTEEAVEIKQKVIKPLAKKVVKPAAAGGNSRLREMIAAARKAKKEEEVKAKSPVLMSPAPTSPAPTSPALPSPKVNSTLEPNTQDKTFEGGFFMVKSPVRSPMVGTPRNKSLLKAVLSSEAKKASASKNSASFAMLRASVFGKNVEYDGIAPLPQTPIDLNATPARSILKSANASAVKSGKKSIKMVLFDQLYDLQESSGSSDREIQNTEVTSKEDIKETDSGVSSMDQDVDNKENSRTKAKLERQDAVDVSPVMTRSRRKSLQTPDVIQSAKRSARKKKVLQESVEEFVETPKRSSRRRKSLVE